MSVAQGAVRTPPFRYLISYKQGRAWCGVIVPLGLRSTPFIGLSISQRIELRLRVGREFR